MSKQKYIYNLCRCDSPVLSKYESTYIGSFDSPLAAKLCLWEANRRQEKIKNYLKKLGLEKFANYSVKTKYLIVKQPVDSLVYGYTLLRVPTVGRFKQEFYSHKTNNNTSTSRHESV